MDSPLVGSRFGGLRHDSIRSEVYNRMAGFGAANAKK
jgi:hypothetical protein